jgi:hypothetical protein
MQDTLPAAAGNDKSSYSRSQLIELAVCLSRQESNVISCCSNVVREHWI